LLTYFIEKEAEGLVDYKALFFRNPKRILEPSPINWRNRYPISISCVTKIFSELGLGFEILYSGSPNSLVLPFSPGLLFLIYLCRFMRVGNIDTIGLRHDRQGGQTQWNLVVTLDDAAAFRAAVLGGGGDTTDKFRELLACRGNLLIDQYSIYRDSNQIDWHPPTRKSEQLGKIVYEIVCDPVFETNNRLAFRWFSDEPILSEPA